MEEERLRTRLEKTRADLEQQQARLHVRAVEGDRMNNTALSGWAKAVLCLTNLVFVVLDTTSLKRDADILRVLVVNREGEEVYHRLVKPVRHPSETNTLYTGITQDELDHAYTLAEQWWPELHMALAGKYVLAYGLDFVRERIADNAQAYHLPALYLIGDCLHAAASQYCHRNSITLAAACAHVGYPQIQLTNAANRAQAQIVLLRAMADGQPRRLSVAAPAMSAATDDLEDDDHPF